MITRERLYEVLAYDPTTGVFTWRIARGTRAAGAIAGSVTAYGDVHIAVDKHYYKGHRLAWLYMTGEWPTDEIDHRDLDPSNNRWDNLRAATKAQNRRNKRRQRNNTTGYKGVVFRHQRKKFQAKIYVDKKVVYLGHFDTAEAAHAAYCRGSKKYHGDFGRVA